MDNKKVLKRIAQMRDEMEQFAMVALKTAERRSGPEGRAYAAMVRRLSVWRANLDSIAQEIK